MIKLRKILQTAGCSLFFSIALPRLASAQDFAARMDQVVQSYVDDRQFMGSVLVARGDTILFSKAYGSANLEWNIPNTTATKFRIGSVTKQFTAVAVLLLEERGRLKIDELVRTYYQDAPEAWNKITLRHLLTHTSGIPNYQTLPGYKSLRTSTATPEELVRSFRDSPLDFVPGEKMSYSNSGYVLLGAIIEKVSGVPYAKFLEENIFKPLGMKDSGYDSSTAIIAHRAAGYEPSPDGLVNATYLDMTIPYGAGALYSTTEDLLRWEQALFGGKILSEASLKKMTTPDMNNYALGLLVRKQSGSRNLIEHGGSISGFRCELVYYPDSKITVVALSNLHAPGVDRIAKKLGALVHGEPYAP